jgi:hypothetical protein
MNKIYIILGISILLISCQKGEMYLSDSFSQTQKCDLKEMSEYPVDSIWDADFIFSYDDYIILSEPKSEFLISFYNIENNDFSRFLTKGDGPNELLDVQQIGLYDDASFFVKSTFMKDIFIYNFDDQSLSFREKIRIPGNNVSFFFANKQAIRSQQGEKRFSIYDLQNGSSVEFGDDVTVTGWNEAIISHILQGLCTGNVKRKRFAWASMYGDLVEIYDYEYADRVRIVNSIRGVLPVLAAGQDLPVFSVETKLGVVSITSTEKNIYILYNENQIKDFSKSKNNILLCDQILVFDWDGKPQKILQMDKQIRSISYNEKYKRIYCVGYDNEGNSKIFCIDGEV